MDTLFSNDHVVRFLMLRPVSSLWCYCIILVLLEQQVQCQDGYWCDDLIRSAYQEFSEPAQSIAFSRGQNHAKAAGHWVVQDLPVNYVQWLYTHLGHPEQTPLTTSYL
jgi:hypothetical protein